MSQPDVADGAIGPSAAEASAEFDPAAALRATRDVASAIATFHTVPEIVGAIAQSLAQLDGHPSVTVGVTDEDGPLRLMALEGFDPSTLDRWGTIDRSAPVPLTDVLRSGEVLHFGSRGEMLGRYPHLADDLERHEHHSWIAIPLLSELGPSGVVGLAWDHQRAVSEVERLFVLTLSKLGGEALRRASRELDREDLVVLLADASENDRIRIAGDLHDRSVQRLAAASIRLGALRMDHARLSGEEVGEGLQVIESEVQEVIRALRNIIVELHPPDMTGLGLAQALDDFAQWLFDGAVSFEIVDDVGLSMAHPVAETAYRIATEALSNVLRHASASSVVVEMRLVAPERLCLVVADDGRGLDDPSQRSGAGHLGLRMIRERVAKLGGSVRIEGRDGVRVAAELPLSGRRPVPADAAG